MFCPPEFIVVIFLRSFLDLLKIELLAPCQLIRSRIEENYSVALDLRLEVVGFRQGMVEVVDTVVDELRMGVERSVLVLEEAILDLFVQRILHRSDRLARHDRDVVIAHVVGRCAELDALVVVDVAVLRIAAEQDHHLDLFDLLADQGDELLQIPSLVGR